MPPWSPTQAALRLFRQKGGTLRTAEAIRPGLAPLLAAGPGWR
jgi:hypothetical protein